MKQLWKARHGCELVRRPEVSLTVDVAQRESGPPLRSRHPRTLPVASRCKEPGALLACDHLSTTGRATPDACLNFALGEASFVSLHLTQLVDVVDGPLVHKMAPVSLANEFSPSLLRFP